MRPGLKVLLIVPALILGPGRAYAQPDLPGKPEAAAGPDTLDRARIHAEYGDGNFETVIQALEDFRSSHKDFRAGDSLFVAKYLGVIYASNPASREKGKYWLYRMLQIDPTADLVDMYIGEEVDRTFEKVRQEFIVRRNYRGINDVKLAKAVRDAEKDKDTVVVRDTVRMGKPSRNQDDMPERKLKDFRYGWTWNLNLGAGLKFMSEEDWPVTSKHKEFRLAFDIRQRRWPINLAFDYNHSRSDNGYVYIRTEDVYVLSQQTSDELNAGVRKIFDFQLYTMRPFMGAGFGYISTKVEYGEFLGTVEEGTMGTWLEGGIYWELEKHFNIGAEVLWSWAKVPVAIVEANAGGIHAAMILGYHW